MASLSSRFWRQGKGVIGELDVATGQEVSAKGADGGTKLLSIFEIDEVLMVVHVNAADRSTAYAQADRVLQGGRLPFNAQFQGSIDSIEPGHQRTKILRRAHGVVKAVFTKRRSKPIGRGCLWE